MFEKIYVPVDNSEYSNRAVDVAVKLGAVFGSKLVGSHVYAAAMHDYRFKQMEFTLPGEYLQEEEIERQRKIHDSLITMGLELISDCYLNGIAEKCGAQGLELERRMMDGKHHVEIVKDIKKNNYDLTVIGVLGIGKNRDSQIGSVCERVVRQANKDVLVVKHLPKDDEPERDTILVCIDGSPHSFGALVTAIEIARKLGKKLELISVYDPYLHYAVFNGIVDVLTEKAAKVFRFEEQNQLHEEIIDTGLAQIYQSHLNIGEKMSKELGVDVTKTLLDGKAFHKILTHARKNPPYLLVIGRVGVHKLKDEDATLGSTTENILRLCECDVLLTTRYEYPELDRRAEESILWTAEAEERMKRVPDTVRGIARRGILRLAIEQGHSVITDSVIQEAMDRFMPKYTAKMTTELAEALALEHARDGKASMCKKCGVMAADSKPVKCSVCGGAEFELITRELVEKIAATQGGIEEELTYDGRELKWSQDARRELNSIEDKYQRRRAKARIEKAARMKNLEIISLQFVTQVIEEDFGRESPLPTKQEQNATNGHGPYDNLKPLSSYDQTSDLKVIGTDENGMEVKSIFSWHSEALERLLKIPAGFMRERTLERVENIALQSQAESITMAHVDSALEVGRRIMEEMVKSGELAVPDGAKPQSGKCPFSSMFSTTDAEKIKEGYAQFFSRSEKKNGALVEKTALGAKTVSHVYTGPVEQILNEAGIMHELAKERLRKE